MKAVGAIVLTLALVSATSAQAAEVDASFILTSGLIDLPAQDFDLPTGASTGIEGTYDDVTGDFTGEMVIADQESTQDVDATTLPPAGGSIDLIISMSADGVTGTIDPATGEVNLVATLTVSVLLIRLTPTGSPTSIPLDVTCPILPGELQLNSDPNGTAYDPVPVQPDSEDGTFEVVASGFNIPVSDCVDGSVPGASALVEAGFNENLGLPTDAGVVTLAFETGEIVPEPPIVPPTVPPTTAPATAPAAAVVTTSPTFTG